MLLALLGILLHGGAGVGNKRLLHRLSHPQTEELVRAVLPPLSRCCAWKTDYSHCHGATTLHNYHKKQNIYLT